MKNLIIIYSEEVNPIVECIIKGRDCKIEKLIDHKEQGRFVKYRYNDNEDFCLLTNLPEDTWIEIKEKYPEFFL